VGLWKHYLVVGGLSDAVNHYRERQENLYEAVQAIRKAQRDLLDAYLVDMAKYNRSESAHPGWQGRSWHRAGREFPALQEKMERGVVNG
jgi:hypothetical protein